MAQVKIAKVDTARVSEVGVVKQIDMIKETQRVGFEIWRAPQVDDAGIRASATWKEAAAVGVAILNTVMANKIAKLQRDIAARYRDMFIEDHNRYMNVYSPSERKYMLEVGSKPIYKENYTGRGNLYEGYLGSAMDITDGWSELITSQVPLCVDPSMLRAQQLQRGELSTAGKDTAYVQENFEKIYQDDLRFKRRADALDRGRSLVVQSATFGQSAANLYGKLGDSIGTAAEGAAGALGYFGARNGTGFPTGVTSYDAVDGDRTANNGEYGNVQSVGGLTNPRSNSQQL